MKYRLGVTGGIGSGKSTVCKIFNVFGIPVFSADQEARIIMDSDEDLKKEINSIAGKNVYISGKLDREGFASLIFNDRDLLSRVNALVHPLVLNRFDKWAENQSAAYVILEAAILFEAGANDRVNKVLAVVAPIEERISRVMDRNRMTREQVMERVKHQISDNEMLKKSDYLINNSENLMVIPQVIDIHGKILLEQMNQADGEIR